MTEPDRAECLIAEVLIERRDVVMAPGGSSAPIVECLNDAHAILDALLDGGYVVLTDKEPLIAWSETKPGVGMVRLAGRTLVVMEQDTFRAFSESPKEPR